MRRHARHDQAKPDREKSRPETRNNNLGYSSMRAFTRHRCVAARRKTAWLCRHLSLTVRPPWRRDPSTSKKAGCLGGTFTLLSTTSTHTYHELASDNFATTSLVYEIDDLQIYPATPSTPHTAHSLSPIGPHRSPPPATWCRNPSAWRYCRLPGSLLRLRLLRLLRPLRPLRPPLLLPRGTAPRSP